MIKLPNLYNQCPFIYNEIFVDNHYHVEPSEIKDQVVIDCGAHYGFFSTLALLYGAKFVHAIEMNYSNLQFLRDNLNLFNPEYYNICNNALHPNNGTKIVTYHKEGFLSEINPQNNGLEVDTINLEDILEEPCVVKMDIEGAEYDVLCSLPPDKLKNIQRLYIEIHGPKQKRLALRKFLCDSGFVEEHVNQLIIDGVEGETEINKYINHEN